MSSGPDTAYDNCMVADGYLDEAARFADDLTDDERGDLALAHDFLRKVIDSVTARNDAALAAGMRAIADAERASRTTVATCPRNHDPMALYATKMADPQGVAVYGEHFGCIQCDEDGWS